MKFTSLGLFFWAFWDIINDLPMVKQIGFAFGILFLLLIIGLLINHCQKELELIKKLQDYLEEWETLGVIPERIGRQGLDELMGPKKKEILCILSEEDSKWLTQKQFTEHDKYRLRNDNFALNIDSEFFSTWYNLRELIRKKVKELR